jgi:urocanate hydratase
MGGAQPLAATFAGACSLNIECQQSRIDFRLRTTRYLDEQATSLDDALARLQRYTAEKPGHVDRPAGQRGRDPARAGAAREGRRLQRPTWSPTRPRPTTWSTATCRRAGPWPNGAAAQATRRQHACRLRKAPRPSCAVHVQAMLDFQAMGIPTVDYGNNIRQVALDQGVKPTPSTSPASCRPTSARCSAAARARSAGWPVGRPGGHPQDRRQDEGAVPRGQAPAPLAGHGAERIAFQGLPARICWIGLGERHRAGLAFNEMVKSGELKAPIVIGRDHLDSGSVASPNRETESMKDGSDAVSDWPLLNALLNTAGGATWVSAAPWRRRRHGLLAALRRGDRLRRHRRGRPSASSACCGTIPAPA